MYYTIYLNSFFLLILYLSYICMCIVWVIARNALVALHSTSLAIVFSIEPSYTIGISMIKPNDFDIYVDFLSRQYRYSLRLM